MRNKIICASILAIAIIFSLSPSIFTMIKTKISEEFYPISADGLSRLHWKLKRSLIKDNYGNKMVAKTDWDVDWQVHTLSNNQICLASEIIVDVTIKYTYPKWSDIAFAPQKDRYLWNKYIDALKKHEEGHAEIGKEAGEKIEKALMSVNSAKTCLELEKALRGKADVIYSEYVNKNSSYDGETSHGANQGAVLPLPADTLK